MTPRGVTEVTDLEVVGAKKGGVEGKGSRREVSCQSWEQADRPRAITGERRAELRRKEAEYFHEEFSYGEFERTLELPEGVNTEKINAEFVNGVLQITAPVAAVKLPKQI
jgi:hypothetical protein